MKFEYDRTKAWWDEYHRFFNCVGYGNAFVVFETGEVICTRRFNNSPEGRITYNDGNVQIVATGDTNCPLFNDPEGKPVAKSWLDDSGQQILLIDHNHGVAVRLGERGGLDRRFVHNWQASVPEALRQAAYAYWPGPNSPPMGAPIVINQTRRLTPAERTHFEGLRAEARAWDTLSEQPERVGHWTGKGTQHAIWHEGENQRKPLPYERLKAVKTYLELSVTERLDLSRHGWNTGLDPRKVSYLKLRQMSQKEEADVDTE